MSIGNDIVNVSNGIRKIRDYASLSPCSAMGGTDREFSILI
jgi:hypothetical protein